MSQPNTESPLRYPLGEHLPPTGQATEVAPGVHWLRMGLPFALDHINLWLLRDRLPDAERPGHDREGWTVVDCGIDNPATRSAWQQVEAQVLQGLPILRVLVTHMHPDHMGLAHWLCERWQAPLWMGLAEYQAAKIASSPQAGLSSASALQFFARHGWQRQEDQATVQRHMNHYAEMVPAVPATHVRLMDGLVLRMGERQWQCVNGLGHSPEHMALWCAADQIFISGDMLLPSISSNISVYHQEPDADPLAWFLQSLARMQALLPEQALVLPSHGRPFRGAHTRVAQLQAHHAERLRELLTACAERPCSAHEALPVLFKRPLNAQQMTFAMGEAVAHLNALWHAGRVQRRLDAADGVYRFSA
ncbi:MAG: Hydroxyacylglutathione hydrolase [Pseudomonadota bacterium]|jgi:glyoxylase-like metal-dependent hydrolase (beta-lactamase superfamily II)